MERFCKIDNAEAVIQLNNGVQKQVPMFHRGERVFIQAAGGFVRICAYWGPYWTTSHPTIKLVDYDAPGVIKKGSELRFPKRLAAVA